ncbi:MAG: addiction module toxin RelE [Ruminococcaceae bacterium]|nr:addiction module toxin RelE [Oscillospiraceae bacterium]
MKILFKNKSVEKQFSSEYANTWRYPKQVQKKLQAAENFIKQATSLKDISSFSPFRFHRLEGTRKSEWSISLGNTGYRVTIIPCDDNDNPIVSGDILEHCKSIRIILVTEVSNHYE